MNSNSLKKNHELSTENGLLAASRKMKESLKVLKDINNRSNIIALNAAIEGARTRGRLDSFTIVAEQILTQATRNGELGDQLEQLVEKLQDVALRSTAARYYELAEDLIDKLDRNLFERNCDVQAWATFEAITHCAKVFENKEATEQFRSKELENIQHEACRVLDRLMATYVVYDEVILCNASGVVVASGKNKEMIGRKFRSDNFFLQAFQGKVHVDEVQIDQATEKLSVSYSAPVKDEDNRIVGVLSTRFNWKYGQEMIGSAGYSPDITAYFTNREGSVIGATDEIGILSDHLNWLDAGLMSRKGYCGYSIERARNGAPIAVGFARTRGYNSYKGKAWSSLITSRIGNVDIRNTLHLAAHRVENGETVVSTTSSDSTLVESELANNELQLTMQKINELVSIINSTNTETDMLAINAAVQAGIAGTEGESFAVIAGEIGKLAEKSMSFVATVNKTAKELQQAVSNTVAARLSDAARDTIDKVDRNLFERYCDVQAWTAFKLLSDATFKDDPDGQVSQLLASLVKIYEVYYDILLLDSKGEVIATGVRRDLKGHNYSAHKWFQEPAAGKVYASEVDNSPITNGLTMTFSAPIYGPDGKISGVLATKFNWSFIYAILDTVIVDSMSKVFLLNSSGTVIGATDRQGILEKSLSHLKVFGELVTKGSGYTTEVDRTDGEEYTVGFARTAGYNTYTGKGWSIITRRPRNHAGETKGSIEEEKDGESKSLEIRKQALKKAA